MHMTFDRAEKTKTVPKILSSPGRFLRGKIENCLRFACPPRLYEGLRTRGSRFVFDIQARKLDILTICGDAAYVHIDIDNILWFDDIMLRHCSSVGH